MENVAEIHTTATEGSKTADDSIYWAVLAMESCNIEYSEIGRALGFILNKMLSDEVLGNAKKGEAERFSAYRTLLEGLFTKMNELDQRFRDETEKRLSDLRAGRPQTPSAS